MQVVTGEVTQLSVDGDQWVLHCRDQQVRADGVMITGPGQAERSILPGHPRVLSIAQFWHRVAQDERINAERVAVIGGGETAATMLITRTQNQQRTLDFELVERDSVVNLEGLRP